MGSHWALFSDKRGDQRYLPFNFDIFLFPLTTANWTESIVTLHSIPSHRGTSVVFPDFQPMRVSEEPVCIYLFQQNPVFTSLHLRSPIHVVPPQAICWTNRQFFGSCSVSFPFLKFFFLQWLELLANSQNKKKAEMTGKPKWQERRKWPESRNDLEKSEPQEDHCAARRQDKDRIIIYLLNFPIFFLVRRPLTIGASLSDIGLSHSKFASPFDTEIVY